jgi:arginyl-tRNA--protein-N-Asp/Glu arginylyltransferase
MAYKIQFQPMQGLIDGRWQPVAPPRAAGNEPRATNRER